ncbi:lipid-A-disaccharide synthase [Legionella sp. D16C41]|uniref:lipid-A-disaccharide synthase n=1 Tax=Legionella sp. D16C41 TaxID=3402688 RepID=UPI003AF8B0CC
MPMPKHIVIIAGEESGDHHAADLVKELQTHDSTIKFSGMGGKHMEEAGVNVIANLAKFGMIGITAVIKHAFVIKKTFQIIKQHLKNTKPDLLILVDCPGFNIPIAKYAKHVLGLRIIYYISPQIWAWKANRIHTLKACVDHMVVIFPFEKAIYQQAGIPVSFVGHPLVQRVQPSKDIAKIKESFNLPLNKKLIALLPGSRRSEIEKHLPIMVKTAEKLAASYDDLHYVMPIAQTLNSDIIKKYFTASAINITFIRGQAIDVIASSHCVVVASGTASLECALMQKPMCIIYKGSFLSYLIAAKVIKVKYLGLCNLLQNKMIVPELLQYDCNAEELTQTLKALITDNSLQERMIARLKKLKHSLSNEQADCSMVDVVKMELSRV